MPQQRQFRSDDSSLWQEKYGSGIQGGLTYSGGDLAGYPGHAFARFSGNVGSFEGIFVDVSYFNGGNGGRIGDIVIIHQSRGSGAGSWELNKISGRSGNTIFFVYPLINTYSTGGDNGAQILSSANWSTIAFTGVTTPAVTWNPSYLAGGIFFFIANISITIDSQISIAGWNGVHNPNKGDAIAGVGGGFVGGKGYADQNQAPRAYSGEGYFGAQLTQLEPLIPGMYNRGDNAGGGSTFNNSDIARSGGGGGNGIAGNQGTNGIAGVASGNAELTLATFGGGGGGGSRGQNKSGGSGSGASGGGMAFLFAPTIIITNSGSITVPGGIGGRGTGTDGQGVEGGGADGGSAAGGSVLLKGQRVDINTNKVLVEGGVGNGATGGLNSAGGRGRFHVDYSNLLTGSAIYINSRRDSRLFNSEAPQIIGA